MDSTHSASISDSRVFDKLGNGTVPAKEFAQYSQILGDRLSDAEVAQLMQHANSGSINYESSFRAHDLAPSLHRLCGHAHM